MSTINLNSTPRTHILNDPKFIQDLQDQMEAIEFELDTFEQPTSHALHTYQSHQSDTSRFCNLVKEHSDLEDVLNSLLDDDGHDLP